MNHACSDTSLLYTGFVPNANAYQVLILLLFYYTLLHNARRIIEPPGGETSTIGQCYYYWDTPNDAGTSG